MIMNPSELALVHTSTFVSNHVPTFIVSQDCLISSEWVLFVPGISPNFNTQSGIYSVTHVHSEVDYLGHWELSYPAA